MAYKLPVFNMECAIRHYAGNGQWEDHVDVYPCQIKGIPKVFSFASNPGPQISALSMLLKLPAKTDVRDSPTQAIADRVSIAGYDDDFYVACVWDVAVGFDNEYRVAALSRTNLNGLGPSVLPGQGTIPRP